MIQIWVIQELPLGKAMGMALGKEDPTCGLNQRQDCGPQWGMAQRNPKREETRVLESEHREVALLDLCSFPKQFTNCPICLSFSRSDSAHRLIARSWTPTHSSSSHCDFSEGWGLKKNSSNLFGFSAHTPRPPPGSTMHQGNQSSTGRTVT
jgi:hypothetical protein